jgi:hypothetical protein
MKNVRRRLRDLRASTIPGVPIYPRCSMLFYDAVTAATSLCMLPRATLAEKETLLPPLVLRAATGFEQTAPDDDKVLRRLAGPQLPAVVAATRQWMGDAKALAMVQGLPPHVRYMLRARWMPAYIRQHGIANFALVRETSLTKNRGFLNSLSAIRVVPAT